MILWRISNYFDLSGSGGRRAGGRWHSRGRPVVYLSENAASCLLEMLIHLEIDRIEEMPKEFCLLRVTVIDRVRIKTIVKLPGDWRTNVNLTRKIGDNWLRSSETLLLKVPSAAVPDTHNFLFNPEHKQASTARIAGVNRHPFDSRLLKIIRVKSRGRS